MNWRVWAYQRLINDPTVTGVIPAAQIHGSGSLTGRPDPLPAAILRFIGSEDRLAPAAEQEGLEVWVHDEPGVYDNIDDILAVVRESLESAVPTEDGTYPPVWSGDSQDLADDQWDTIVRNSSYTLLNRKAIA